MNTLCHLCLGLRSPEILLGQFLGDFVRGPVDALPYPVQVRRGIRAHRRVDAAGEAHPFLKAAKQLLPAENRRYGGILVDLYGDYLLLRCWEQLMESDWEEAYAMILGFLHSPPGPFPADAQGYARFLIRHQLIPAYADPGALPEIFDRVGQRLRKPVALSPLLAVLRQREPQFIRDFPAYFTDMKAESDRICFPEQHL